MQEIINLIKESEVGSHQRSYQVKQLELYIKEELNFPYKYAILPVKNIMNQLRTTEDERSIIFWCNEMYKQIKANKERLDKLANKKY